MNDLHPFFGRNRLQLTLTQGLLALVVSLGALSGVAIQWSRRPLPQAVAEMRIPYELSRDYALYERHLITTAQQDRSVFVVGDSVVWGEYVTPEGTLSHFLSQEHKDIEFINAGLNGLFPLALEGLVKHYGRGLRDRKVLLHCNLLWMSSPEADLSAPKEQVFNHVDLVPQWSVRIPCYKADMTDRTARVVRRWLPHLRWVRHLQVSHWDGQSLPEWTLADDNAYPPAYPNTYRNPWAALAGPIPEESVPDPERGPGSPRHRSWLSTGRKPQAFAWVPLNQSLQWAAFQRLAEYLERQSAEFVVVIGPFNTHMVADTNRASWKEVEQQVRAWLDDRQISWVAPETLPAEMYGDASHPLTDGYAELARRLLASKRFVAFLEGEAL